MLTTRNFYLSFPTLANFRSAAYKRKSSLGRIHLVRKNRVGTSASRMFDRRIKIKRSLNSLINTGQISPNANLATLNLKNISSPGKRKAYAKLVRRAARNIHKVI